MNQAEEHQANTELSFGFSAEHRPNPEKNDVDFMRPIATNSEENALTSSDRDKMNYPSHFLGLDV